MKIFKDVVDLGTITTDTFSESFELDSIMGYAIQVKVSNATGLSDTSVTLQGSAAEIPEDSDWFTIEDSATLITEDDSVVFNVADVFYKHVRVSLEISSGSMDVELKIFGKGW